MEWNVVQYKSCVMNGEWSGARQNRLEKLQKESKKVLDKFDKV